jgi:hypothetical protein
MPLSLAVFVFISGFRFRAHHHHHALRFKQQTTASHLGPHLGKNFEPAAKSVHFFLLFIAWGLALTAGAA